MEFEHYNYWKQPINIDPDDYYFEEDILSFPFDQTESKKKVRIFDDVNAYNERFEELNHSFNSIEQETVNKCKYEKTVEISNGIKKQKEKYVKNKKSRKRKLKLSQKAQYLKNNYYLVFTKKKKFPKTIIKKIHNIIKDPLNLKPMTREVVRFNDKYFEEYSNESFNIIQYLVLHREEILDSIPELLKYI